MSKIETTYIKFNKLHVEGLYQILKMRSEIFNVEQGILCNDLDDLDLEAIHVRRFVDNVFIGYLRIIVDNVIKIGRLCILKEYRKRYHASNMISNVLLYIEKHYPKRDIEIISQTYIKNLYKKFNFVEIGEVFDIYGQKHVKMIRRNNENII